MTDLSCTGNSNGPNHFHADDQIYRAEPSQAHLDIDLEMDRISPATGAIIENQAQNSQGDQHSNTKNEVGFRRIVRNFTPSYVYILMIIINFASSIDVFVVGS